MHAKVKMAAPRKRGRGNILDRSDLAAFIVG